MLKKITQRAIILITIIISLWYFLLYSKEANPFYGDAMGYYMYLPTTFIYHNHDDLDKLPTGIHYDANILYYMQGLRAHAVRSPKGYIINQYTYGVALMEMPFFFIAHGYEKITGGMASGYSTSYQNMIKVSSFLYALFGLIILFRILKYYFEPTVSLLATCIIFIGTNLFWFSLCQAGMAHVPLFFLYASLIYLTIKLYNNPKHILFIVAGLVSGLITVIRPSDALCLLIPLLYNVYNKETIVARLRFLKDHIGKILLFAIAFIIPVIPQLVYWKIFAGSFVYDSYTTNQSFNWLHPRILDGLFSFANGWLAYSPVMFFALAGLLFYKRTRPWNYCLYVILPVYIYIIYSWYCYNYINGLGSRPMIHLYPLLALPLAAFIQFLAEKKLVLKIIFSTLILFCIVINISYSIQQITNLLHSEESNMTYNLQIMFRTHLRYNDLVVHDNGIIQPDQKRIQKLATLACENYEDSLSHHYVRDPSGASRYVYHMEDSEEYLPKFISIKYDKQKFGGARWLKCSGVFMCPKGYIYFNHLLVLNINRGDERLLWKACRIDDKIGLAEDSCSYKEVNLVHDEINKWGGVYFFVDIPKNIADGDIITLDIWNMGKQEMYMDNMCLETYK
jgi:hypothetical protein